MHIYFVADFQTQPDIDVLIVSNFDTDEVLQTWSGHVAGKHK